MRTPVRGSVPEPETKAGTEIRYVTLERYISDYERQT